MRGEGEDFFQMGGSSVLSGGGPMGGIDFDGRDVSKKIVRWEGGRGTHHKHSNYVGIVALQVILLHILLL